MHAVIHGPSCHVRFLGYGTSRVAIVQEAAAEKVRIVFLGRIHVKGER